VRDFGLGCTEAFLRRDLSKDHEARIPSGKKEDGRDTAGELDRLGKRRHALWFSSPYSHSIFKPEQIQWHL